MAPTDGEPVKNRWSNGSSANAAATSGPPVTTWSSSGSKYCGATRFISSAVRGVTSDILIITRLPAANAAAAGRTTRLSGKFHGPMIPTTPRGVDSIWAFNPNSRPPRMIRWGRIHSATWARVCSITGMMPTISVNRDAAAGPGAEVGGHRVDERVGVVQHQRQQPIDAVASFRARSAGPAATNACRCRSRVARRSARSRSAASTSFLRRTHLHAALRVSGPTSAASHMPIVMVFGKPHG